MKYSSRSFSINLIRISISKFPTRLPSKSSFKLIKKTDSSQAQQQMKKADQQEETPIEKHNIRDYDRAWEDDRL
ncbi:hypothetical protein [Peribacillus frigoritolerans]|uniref:Uncharacterized protein n=1 Tax=Peribacillus castrilensis TaxID=2897690 RepID=A0AAW9NE31_9BACI|nr:hypothetical protein [Peribacillus castrilensis]